MPGSLHTFASFDELARSLGDRIVADLNAAVGARGRASLVVPGGSTPGALFDVLRRRDVPWDRLTVTLTDERWVALDSGRSNERLVRTRLLPGVPLVQFVSLKSNHSHARDATEQIEAGISGIARPFDVILAGMGGDGHTASWIPGARGLREALDPHGHSLVGAIEPPPASQLDERMTLTLRALQDARAICVLMRGVEKRRAYEKALAGRDIFAMPIRALILQDRVPVEFFWTLG